jgi:hypothetical protein
MKNTDKVWYVVVSIEDTVRIAGVGLAQRVSGRKNCEDLSPPRASKYKARLANGHAGCTNKTDQTKAYVESISRAG